MIIFGGYTIFNSFIATNILTITDEAILEVILVAIKSKKILGF
jgi:hypothetical protein